MTTKTRPTTKKLPRARVMWGDTAELKGKGRVDARPAQWSPDLIPVAVIPTHTAAQAKRIVKAAPFLQLTEEEQVEQMAEAISDSKFRKGIFRLLAEEIQDDYRSIARAVLKCMGLGGRGGK